MFAECHTFLYLNCQNVIRSYNKEQYIFLFLTIVLSNLGACYSNQALQSTEFQLDLSSANLVCFQLFYFYQEKVLCFLSCIIILKSWQLWPFNIFAEHVSVILLSSILEDHVSVFLQKTYQYSIFAENFLKVLQKTSQYNLIKPFSIFAGISQQFYRTFHTTFLRSSLSITPSSIFKNFLL